MRWELAPPAAALLACLTAACTSERLAFLSQSPAQPNPLAINMAGRWLLTLPGVGQCHMTFAAGARTSEGTRASEGARASEGTITPEGGCPGHFYTSRRWAYEQGAIVIRDHRGEALAQLAPNEAGQWLEGRTTSGESILLTH